MKVLLELQLIDFKTAKDVIDTMLSSVELNGPVVYSDCATSLWIIILDLKARNTPSLVYDTSERILRWLFLRWRPCECNRFQAIPELMTSFSSSTSISAN